MATDFPKVTFMKKLLLSAMFFGVFSMQQVHAANVMEGIFKGMVASTDPASVRTASRVGDCWGEFLIPPASGEYQPRQCQFPESQRRV
ncbi:hypothetical protein ACB272_04605 [Klebsiella pneumoniae]